MTDRRFNVLFICVGNSARSIMAEAILAELGKGKFRAFSAGTRPYSEMNPYALQVLEGLGHDVSVMRAKNIGEFQGADAPPLDFVFTLCDQAANEECPPWPGQPISAHWGMTDPVRGHRYRGREGARLQGNLRRAAPAARRPSSRCRSTLSTASRCSTGSTRSDRARRTPTRYRDNGAPWPASRSTASAGWASSAFAPSSSGGVPGEIVLLNDAAGDPATHAHLFEFDSVHGRWPALFAHDDDSVSVNGRRMLVTKARRIEDLPLRDLAIDLVVECTGAFKTAAAARSLLRRRRRQGRGLGSGQGRGGAEPRLWRQS